MEVTVSRKAHFNAAHRLNNDKWSITKNEEIFSDGLLTMDIIMS